MAETKSEKLPFSALEAALAKLTSASPEGKVTMAAMLRELSSGKAQNLQNRIDRLITGSDEYFSDRAGNYQLKRCFFSGFQFLITPGAWEIANGLLVPGHRFAPFLHEEIFPSETVLLNNGNAVPVKEISAPLAHLFPYYMLLGSEQIFDVFMADSPANLKLRGSRKPEEQITVHVFDMADFYKENGFSEGDALLCTVSDFGKGEISFTALSGDNRRSADVKSWIKAFETALHKELDRFEDYLEIPDQIAWSCYLGAGELPPAEKGASLDEMIRQSLQIQIGDNGEHTVLIMPCRNNESSCSCGHDHDHAHNGMELPEGLTISRGETSEIGLLLSQAGSPLSPVEVDSFILDNCYARELEFEDFFARAFGREKLQFADEAQQIVFYNYIEERFEELTGSYNRYDDEPKAPIRSTIMELVEERLEFLDFLSSVNNRVEDLPQEEMQELAGVAQQLNEILRLLNNPGFTPEQVELEQLADTVESRTDDQERIIAGLTKHIENKNEQ